MLMPDALFALVRAFAARYPVPTGLPGEAHEEACRAWTTQLCQQAAWSFPGARYGAKRADPGRPLSKDTLAQDRPDGLIGWDVLIGAGTGLPAVIGAPGPSLDLRGQAFVEVLGINWLDAPAPMPDPPPTPEPPPAPSCGCAEVAAQVAALTALLTPLLRPQPDGSVRLAVQIDQRVKIGW